MKPKREGPFRVTEVLGPLTYRLQLLPTSWRIHNVFHATLLKPYRENETYRQNFPEPPPELVEGEEVYEIETILNHRKRGRGYQYYVKWQGYYEFFFVRKKLILYQPGLQPFFSFIDSFIVFTAGTYFLKSKIL